MPDLNELSLRPYEPGDEARILATFNLVFREVCGPSYVDRDLAYWRWQFLENPAGHRIHLAVAADGTVAAQYAAIPARAVTPAGPTTFSQVVDSFVHPDYRHGLKRPGLFVHTAKPAMERWATELGDGLFWGLPVPEAKRISIRFLDYIEWRPIDYLCRELDEPGGTVPAAPAGVSVRKVSVIGSELAPLSTAVTAEKRCTLVRDARYLNWRYARCPGSPYDVYEARRGADVVGLCVVRARHELVGGALAIAELLVRDGDDEVLDALLAAATARAAARDRRRVMAVLPPASFEARGLERRGFRVVPSADTVYRSIGLCVRQAGLTVEQLEHGWWYTLGDCDLV